MAAGIIGKWALNTTNLHTGAIRYINPDLLGRFPSIMGNLISVAFIPAGWYPHQKTTKSGLALPTKVSGDDGVGRSR